MQFILKFFLKFRRQFVVCIFGALQVNSISPSETRKLFLQLNLFDKKPPSIYLARLVAVNLPRLNPVTITCISTAVLSCFGPSLFELRLKKNCLQFFNQLRHNPCCTATKMESGLKFRICEVVIMQKIQRH